MVVHTDDNICDIMREMVEIFGEDIVSLEVSEYIFNNMAPQVSARVINNLREWSRLKRWEWPCDCREYRSI